MHYIHKIMDPILTLDRDSPVPAVQQIADGLRVLLVEGILKPGDGLPPVRELALELVVHFNTVAQAYRLLEEEGWLELRRKHGTLVRQRTAPQPAPETNAAFVIELTRLLARYRSRGLSVLNIAAALGKQTLKLEEQSHAYG